MNKRLSQSARRALHPSAEQKPVLRSLKKWRKMVLPKNQGSFSSSSSATQALLNRASHLPCPCMSANYQFMLFMCLSWMLCCYMLVTVPWAVAVSRANCTVTSVGIVVQKRAVLFRGLHISCSPLLFPWTVLNSSHTVCGFDWPPFLQPVRIIICTLTMLTLTLKVEAAHVSEIWYLLTRVQSNSV